MRLATQSLKFSTTSICDHENKLPKWERTLQSPCLGTWNKGRIEKGERKEAQSSNSSKIQLNRRSNVSVSRAYQPCPPHRHTMCIHSCRSLAPCHWPSMLEWNWIQFQVLYSAKSQGLFLTQRNESHGVSAELLIYCDFRMRVIHNRYIRKKLQSQQ